MWDIIADTFDEFADLEIELFDYKLPKAGIEAKIYCKENQTTYCYISDVVGTEFLFFTNGEIKD